MIVNTAMERDKQWRYSMPYIPYREGKVYDKAHLRPFDLVLAKAGHPICTVLGREVQLLREASNLWAYDEWVAGINESGYWYPCIHKKETYFANNLRLAPLAVKDGRPLHVGDVIESMKCRFDPFKLPKWETVKVATDSFRCYLEGNLFLEWRFPKDEK